MTRAVDRGEGPGVVLITGSTDGIGKHTATRLAQMGATVVMHGRNAARLEAAQHDVRRVVPGADVRGIVADLSALRAVRDMAQRIADEYGSIDVLINNAGVFEDRRRTSEDGYEMTWAVNVLAPYVLTSCLQRRVTRRIVNVASISASSHIDFDNLNQEKRFSSHDAYSLSKLAAMIFTIKLASIIPQPPTVNCLDPGTVNTKMLYAGWGPCGIEIEDANDETWLATDAKLNGVSGKYFVSRRERRYPACVHDEAVQNKFWDVLQQHTGLEWESAAL